MTKKKNLAKIQKAQLRRSSAMVFLLTLTLVFATISCYACSQDPAPPRLTQEQKNAQDKAYWEAIIMDTNWDPQISRTNDAKLPLSQTQALSLNISYDAQNKQHTVQFKTNAGIVLGNAILSLISSEGTLDFNNDIQWNVKFTENGEKTSTVLAITPPDWKVVYYDLIPSP